MPKQLSVASVIEKNRLASDVPFVVCLDIRVIDPTTQALVETLRLVRNSDDITYNGFVYTAIMFDIELKQDAGVESKISLAITDYTAAIAGRMNAYGGGIGFLVTVMVVNTGALGQPPEVIENFEVIGATASEYVANFELGMGSALARVFPRRKQTRDFCQWRYKEAGTCNYTGGLPTCDLTLQGPNGCAAHGNAPRFGAYPGISSNGARYV